MREPILITGTAGMVGSHLLEKIIADKRDVIATYFRPTIQISKLKDAAAFVELDVRNAPPVAALIAERRPQSIFHLAAQSLPTISWDRPQETMEINATGTINLFEAIKAARREYSAYDPVVVVACSSAEYGASLTPENVPIREDAPLLPLHPYGVSKVAQDLLAFQYFKCDGIKGVRARIFNSTGPRKRDDVISDFAARTARIMRDGGKLRVGNLETRRAILDVRDLVAALIALAEKGEPGEAYNICAEMAYRIGDLVAIFEKHAGVRLRTEIDPSLLRPMDEPIIFGDNGKIMERTGWRPTVSIDETIKAVLEYEVAALAAEATQLAAYSATKRPREDDA